MSRIVVIGGSVAGLASALALARSGHAVTILEQDATPLPADPVAAFHAWERKGAPQVWHSHAFLSRLRNLLRDRAPDVLEALIGAGAEEMPFGENLPPEMGDVEIEPGDADLTMLACRRVTFEWVLRRAALAEPSVDWEGGVEVTGLEGAPDADTGILRIGALRGRGTDGHDLRRQADLVVDASGRRSRLPGWLAALGVSAVEEEDEGCGIFYASRFYRLHDGAELPRPNRPVAMDLGYLKYAVFPGDARIFSVTLAASTRDEALRRVSRPEIWDRVTGELPPVREWLDPRRAQPITDVFTMASLRNRRRRFVHDERPVALGVHAVGDAAVCTNPLYGRGCTLAVVHAWLLADALAEHPGDDVAAALAFDAATRRELDPWYQAALVQDRDAREVMDRELEPQPEREAPLGPNPPANAPVDPKAFMRSVFQEGLLPAMRTDVVVLRAVMRMLNLVDPFELLMANPALVQRVIAAWQDRENRIPQAEMGPQRAAMLEVLEAA